MKVIEVAYTGYPVTDLKRARRFYEGVLGLKEARFFGDENKGFVEYDIGSSTLAIGNGAPDWSQPSSGGGSVALEVDDFAAAVTQLKASGCAFRLEPLETPVCHMAVVTDPDGNSVTIHHRKAR
jgi:catechol 2,3-dioxygenase-like lactoylglutathione lyase family enzyme